MNYRHAFHAGNFADVHKHTALVLLLSYLRQKPAAFRVIDTHAGAGAYDLASPDAERTGEWRGGVGQLAGLIDEQRRAEDVASESQRNTARELLAPYLAVVAAANAGASLRRYPGSPLIIKHFLRAQDRLIACEAEPTAARLLSRALGRDARVKAIAIDGWRALSAYIPPKERRGFVLIDPPYERPDEFPALAEALGQAWRKWPTGTYLAWYPLKSSGEPNRLARDVSERVACGVLRSELSFAPKEDTQDRLRGSGLLIVNPPWRLDEQLRVIGAELARLLSAENPCRTSLDWVRAPP